MVATDDHRIYAACQDLGIRCLMTGEHPTGTDRVAECAEKLEADGYINVQGDEPFISPAAIDAVCRALAMAEPSVMAVNACAEIRTPAAVADHNVVKVVTTTTGNAMAFSRQPIPYPRSGYPAYLRQLGLYGFTPTGINTFRSLPEGSVERVEGIEMLRFLEGGHQVRMIFVEDSGIAVDTPADLRRAHNLLPFQSPRCSPTSA